LPKTERRLLRRSDEKEHVRYDLSQIAPLRLLRRSLVRLVVKQHSFLRLYRLVLSPEDPGQHLRPDPPPWSRPGVGPPRRDPQLQVDALEGRLQTQALSPAKTHCGGA
ncbi:unnamed protein product, partial [Gadus morhua 'NCC']